MRITVFAVVAFAFAVSHAPAQHAWYPAPSLIEPGYYRGVAAIDVDADGRPEVAIGRELLAPQIGSIEFRTIELDGSIPAVPLLALTMPAGSPIDFEVLDWTGDGTLDLVVVGSDGTFVFPGLPGGGFAAAQAIGTLGDERLAFGDANQDGAVDLFQVRPTSGLFRVSVNDGAGGIAADNSTFTPKPISIAVADFDADGLDDVATVADVGPGTQDLDNVIVHRGLLPNATYVAGLASTWTSSAKYIHDIVAVDVNFDGAADCAAACEDFAQLLRSNGSTGFLAPNNFPNVRAWRFQLGDLDGDAHPDILGTNEHLDTIQLIEDVAYPTEIRQEEVGLRPRALTLADFTGDGLDDLAAVGGGGNPSITIWRGLAQGELDLPRSIHLVENVKSFTAGDVDGDGHTDVVQGSAPGNPNNPHIFCHWGDGAGNLGTPSSVVSNIALDFRLADLDQDGDIDAIWRSYSAGKPNYTLQVSPRTFGPVAEIASLPTNIDFDLGDVDQDGDADVVLTADTGAETGLRILENVGFPSFTVASTPFATDNPMAAARFGDVDGDGDLDALAFVDNGFGQPIAGIWLALSTGSAAFPPATFWSAGGDLNGNSISNLHVRDVDGDGRDDVTMIRKNSYPDAFVALLRGSPAGLSLPITTPIPWGSAPLSLGDVDCDGRVDAFIGSSGGDIVEIRLQHLDGTFGPANSHAGVFENGMMTTVHLDDDAGVDLISARSVEFHILLHETFGFVDAYGTGCAGAGGFVPSLTATSPAIAGSPLSVTLSQAQGGATALFFFGAGKGTTPVGLGCSLLLSPLLPLVVAVPIPGSGPGNGTLSFGGTLPAAASGACFSMQAFVAETPSGFCATNGIFIAVL